MWQRYFGPYAKIIGIDINPDCKRHKSPGIFIRIGDQSDPDFLQSLIDEFGVPDIVLDDGSHSMDHILCTFQFLYPRLHKNAIYMVEDLHTTYWEVYGGGADNQTRLLIFLNRAWIDSMQTTHVVKFSQTT